MGTSPLDWFICLSSSQTSGEHIDHLLQGIINAIVEPSSQRHIEQGLGQPEHMELSSWFWVCHSPSVDMFHQPESFTGFPCEGLLTET